MKELCPSCDRDSYGMDAIYVHDPTAMAAVLAPELFGWEEGQARFNCLLSAFMRARPVDKDIPAAWGY